MRAGIRAVAFLALGALAVGQAAGAEARLAYVANAGSGDVSVVNTQTGRVVGDPIPTGEGSWSIALAPDGKYAFVVNYSASDVSVIDTETNQIVGKPIKVSSLGFRATGVAISPDGQTAYVTSEGGFDPGEVTSIGVATKQVVGQPLKLKHGAGGIAISPDGKQIYVSGEGERGRLWMFHPGDRSVSREIDTGAGHIGHIAVTPNGEYVLASNSESQGVSVIDASSLEVVGPPIEVGAGPQGLAISPNGNYAYVANHQAASISVIDISSSFRVIDEIALDGRPWQVAFSPSGDRAYISTDSPDGVTVIDVTTRQVIGEPIEVGSQPEGIAVMPNQSPIASFFSSSPLLGASVFFNAAGSSDPDGQIARYDWDFGDGQTAPNGGPTPSHVYGTPGAYAASLTVTDNEGCSTAFVFTGQTAYCNGGLSANQTQMNAVAAPAALHGIAFASRLILVKGRRALLKLRCRGLGACQGVAKLTAHSISRRGRRHRSRRETLNARRVLIGRSGFAIRAGRTKVARVRLSRRGKRFLRAAPRHRLRGQLTGTGIRSRAVLLWQPRFGTTRAKHGRHPHGNQK